MRGSEFLVGSVVLCAMVACAPSRESPYADGAADGAAPDGGVPEPAECDPLASWSEDLVASPTEADAPELPRDVTARVTSASGGYIVLRTTEMHTTFEVLVLGTDAATLAGTSGVPVGDARALRCGGRSGLRIEHHSHAPSAFALRLPAGEAYVRHLLP